MRYICDGPDAVSALMLSNVSRHALLAALRRGRRLLLRALRPQDATSAVDLPTARRPIQSVPYEIQCVPDSIVRVRDPELGRRARDGRGIALGPFADVAIGRRGTVGVGALRSLATRAGRLAAPHFASVGVTVHEGEVGVTLPAAPGAGSGGGRSRVKRVVDHRTSSPPAHDRAQAGAGLLGARSWSSANVARHEPRRRGPTRLQTALSRCDESDAGSREPAPRRTGRYAS